MTWEEHPDHGVQAQTHSDMSVIYNIIYNITPFVVCNEYTHENMELKFTVLA
jgi:hypothetical protein